MIIFCRSKDGCCINKCIFVKEVKMSEGFGCSPTTTISLCVPEGRPSNPGIGRSSSNIYERGDFRAKNEKLQQVVGIFLDKSVEKVLKFMSLILYIYLQINDTLLCFGFSICMLVWFSQCCNTYRVQTNSATSGRTELHLNALYLLNCCRIIECKQY